MSIDVQFNFAGKTVLVTGASAGIGAGIVRRFAQSGATVIIHYRQNKEEAHRLQHELHVQGLNVHAIGADLTHLPDVETLFEQATATVGQVDILVNNAGIYPLHSVLEMDVADWDAVMNANLKSAFLCTQAFARQFQAQPHEGTASIINIGSIEAENPAPLHSHYNASKGGLLMYTMACAHELAPLGIRVNMVSPGLIWREGIESNWAEGVKRWEQSAPLKRLGQPQDVADACLFFASSAASWITGVNLRVDGGIMTKQIF
ncbi:MAG: SDR family NAD(P)-dependent oxidoreductase [Phototrophicaceae bacterium]